MSNESAAVFPLVGWNLSKHPDQPCLFFQPSLITGPMHPIDQPLLGRIIALTPAIARELGEKLIAAADDLERRGETAGDNLLN